MCLNKNMIFDVIERSIREMAFCPAQIDTLLKSISKCLLLPSAVHKKKYDFPLVFSSLKTMSVITITAMETHNRQLKSNHIICTAINFKNLSKNLPQVQIRPLKCIVFVHLCYYRDFGLLLVTYNKMYKFTNCLTNCVSGFI